MSYANLKAGRPIGRLFQNILWCLDKCAISGDRGVCPSCNLDIEAIGLLGMVVDGTAGEGELIAGPHPRSVDSAVWNPGMCISNKFLIVDCCWSEDHTLGTTGQ